MDELKPCPFCGKPPYVAEEMDPEDWWFLECRTINCVGPGVYGRTSIESAIEKWNRRAALAATQAGWISVKDRLPDFGQSVLIGWADGGVDMAYRYRFKHDQSRWSWSNVIEEHHDLPAYWMPLPAAPESSVASKEETGS